MIIQELNGNFLDTSDYKLKRLFHYIPSAVVNNDTASVEGRSDLILNSKTNNRVITVEFLYNSFDIYDYYMLRDEINSLFIRDEPFYIIFKKEPYKRYLVRTNSQFQVPPNPHMQSFNVEFILLENYGESLITTSQITSKDWDSSLYAWNGVINWDAENPPSYSFTTKNFAVFNFGTAKIDPRNSFLEITIKGSGNSLKITNTTNGNIYMYNAPLTTSDNLYIRGVRTFKNNTSDFKNTNKQLISLEPGVNSFQIEITTLQSISFNTRFLYK